MDDLLTLMGPWIQLTGRVFASQEYQRKIEAVLSQWDAEAAEIHMAGKSLKKEVEGVIVEALRGAGGHAVSHGTRLCSALLPFHLPLVVV